MLSFVISAPLLAGLCDILSTCAGSSPGEQATFLKLNEYYFYQASDGQWLFLTALDMRILLAHYGAYGALPGRLAAQVVNIDNITQTEVMRKKIKFLGHLPLTGACSVPPAHCLSCLRAHRQERLSASSCLQAHP